MQSSDNTLRSFQYGLAIDNPVPADYDGDGRADTAVTHVQNGYLYWYLNRTTLGYIGFQFGVDVVKSVLGDYDSDRKPTLPFTETEISCLVPECAGDVKCITQIIKETLWDKFYTAASLRQRHFAEQYKIVKKV